MSIEQLAETAQAMVAAGKGIIAIDESNTTIAKRFDGVGIPNTEENRRAYRELLLGTPNLGEYISGAILYDETIWQKCKDGTPLVEIIKKAGSIPGIKVDEGTKPLPGCPGELITVGLDKLADRLPKYHAQGARFAKWRAVIDIGKDRGVVIGGAAEHHAVHVFQVLARLIEIGNAAIDADEDARIFPFHARDEFIVERRNLAVLLRRQTL